SATAPERARPAFTHSWLPTSPTSTTAIRVRLRASRLSMVFRREPPWVGRSSVTIRGEYTLPAPRGSSSGSASGPLSSALQCLEQRILKLGMPKGVAECFELRGRQPLAGQDGLFPHLAQDDPNRPGWDGKGRGTGQGRGQLPRKLAV